MSDPLIEFVDAEFFVTGAISPADDQNLLAALRSVAGVAEAGMVHHRIDVHYEPVIVTKKEIGERIEAAGYRITKVESAASSPITDLELPS